jgi:hypothetical protein
MKRNVGVTLLVMILAAILPISIIAQTIIKGRVINGFTKETVPFASVQWKKAGFGVNSDSAGQFSLRISSFKTDSLVVNYVGHAPNYIAISSLKDTGLITLLIGETKLSGEVQVKSKFSKGLRWWKNVVTNKPKNNPQQFPSYSFNLYNKLEIDLNNIKKEKFNNIKLMKPFGFVLDNIDSVSEEKPFLPVFLTETLSNNYYTNNPESSREEIYAQQTHGLKNESFLQFINGINQKINVYNNELSLFGKEFISPLSSVADRYYNFKGADTIQIGNQKYFHLLFSPKTAGENTFSGDCWIHSSSWAIQRISLNIAEAANINFVKRLSISQEFKLIDSTKWVFAKDIFVAEVSPLKKDKFSFIGRKTKIYSNIHFNKEMIAQKLQLNKTKNESILHENAAIIDKQYWNQNRTEPLTINEQKILVLIDTLKSVPVFKKYAQRIEFIVGGYKKLGKYEIGPWYKWVSGNPIERLRLRFDLGTTDSFSKYWRFHTYIAYGTRDNRFKGKFDFNYRFPNNKGWSVFGSYINDLDNGKIKFNDEDVTTDNLFSQLIRRPNIPQKFLGIQEYKIGFGKEWPSSFSVNSFFSKIDYRTYTPLPSTGALSDNPIINSEMVLKFRYAPGERVIHSHRKDFKVRSNQPIYEMRFGHSFKGLFNGEYEINKLNASIRQQFRIPRFGQVNYNLYAGKIWSKTALPFMLLELHPGNEIYYYNKESFNLMNRFEYFSDRFVGITIEHNIEKKLLNLLPFMRKSSIRQFWNFKTVWGNLDLDSRFLNRTDFGDYRLRSLRGDFYTEFGTGLDNIAKFFRVDLVWRVNPYYARTNPALVLQNNDDFGIFGSFRLQF